MSVAAMNRHSASNWEMVDALTDETIDTSDIPPLTEDELASMVVQGPRLPMISVDVDLLIWFKAQEGDVTQTINQVLRSYVAAHNGPGG